MRKAKAYYYPESDSLMIDVADGPAARTEEVAPNLLIGYGADGNAGSIEFPAGVREVFATLIHQEVESRLAQQKAS